MSAIISSYIDYNPSSPDSTGAKWIFPLGNVWSYLINIGSIKSFIFIKASQAGKLRDRDYYLICKNWDLYSAVLLIYVLEYFAILKTLKSTCFKIAASFLSVPMIVTTYS